MHILAYLPRPVHSKLLAIEIEGADEEEEEEDDDDDDDDEEEEEEEEEE